VEGRSYKAGVNTGVKGKYFLTRKKTIVHVRRRATQISVMPKPVEKTDLESLKWCYQKKKKKIS